MKKTRSFAIAAIFTAAVLSACGSQKTETTAASTAAVSTEAATTEAAATAAESTTASAAAESETSYMDKKAPSGEMQGVVIDAAMNTMTIQTKEGAAYAMSKSEDCDTTGIKNGITLGMGITATVDDNGTIVKLADAKTKAEDTDGLAAAGSVILALQMDDMDSFADLCSYPVYIGLDDKTVATAEDLKKNYTADKLFTQELKDSVLSTDLMDLEKREAGLVLSANGEKPDIILNLTNDGWKVTGVNY